MAEGTSTKTAGPRLDHVANTSSESTIQRNVTTRVTAEERAKEHLKKPIVGTFKVIAGVHNEGSVTYETGSIVESRKDLTALPGGNEKFVRVDDKDRSKK